MSRQVILLFFICVILFSCKKQNPCDILVNGVYQFPTLPKNHGMTSQQVTEFWDLPEDVSCCITTKGLIETCLDYPELRLIHAGSNPQSGYDLLVKARFRGIRELETRPDKGTFLLKKFKTVDPLGYDPNWEPVQIGAYIFDIIRLEIIFSQYVNLETLTNQEKIELIDKAIVVYEEMKDVAENYGLAGLEYTTCLMGRLMYLDNYDKMVNLYNSDHLVSDLLDIYGPTSFGTVELVYTLSKEYLDELKN